MNKLESSSRAQVINCLIEGCSIRATVRMTGVAKKTVMRALLEVGEVCADYQDRVFRNLQSRRLQLDEMWAWIYCKEKNRTEEIARKNPDAGDIWLWVCVDADSKLVPSCATGAARFGHRERLRGRYHEAGTWTRTNYDRRTQDLPERY